MKQWDFYPILLESLHILSTDRFLFIATDELWWCLPHIKHQLLSALVCWRLFQEVGGWCWCGRLEPLHHLAR